VRPDIDKLCRAVLDAITMSGVIHDDAQVVSLFAHKFYETHKETEGVNITVGQFDE
jgi:Holliday junction resolvase RusA-like endonuclease